MAARRDPKELLALLVAADAAAEEPQGFVMTYTSDGPVVVGHPGWPDEEEGAPATVEVDDLEERGWVRVTRVDGAGRAFALTEVGRKAARAHELQCSPTAGPAVTLDWAMVGPVLERFHEAYEAAGAPEHGVHAEAVLRTADDPVSARAAVRELVRAGYLDVLADTDQLDVPWVVRPTPLTLQLLARWPGSTAEAAFADLIGSLDQAIASAADEGKRSTLVRVRDGLLGAARDVALAYLERKVGA